MTGPRGGSRLRRLLVALTALTLLGLASASSASAWAFYPSVYVPWPHDTVTYYAQFDRDASENEAALNRAVLAFNRANTGYRLVPSTGADDVSRLRNANIVISSLTAREEPSDGGCGGYAYPGWDFGGTFVSVGGGSRCDRFVRTLTMAHELAHVFLLIDTGDIDDPRAQDCSIVNRVLRGPRGKRRLAAPDRCPVGRQYWRSPFRPDDVAGIRAVREQPFHFPEEICRPKDEPDAEDSAYIQGFTLCRFQYDCRGRGEAAPGDPDISRVTDANGRYPWLANCQESDYPRSQRDPDNTGQAKDARHRRKIEAFGP